VEEVANVSAPPIKRSETGCRVGDSHHNAKVPDAVVVQARDMYEYEHMIPAEIARKLGVLHGIVYYTRRNVTAREREG
jgi:hypothetical protein